MHENDLEMEVILRDSNLSSSADNAVKKPNPFNKTNNMKDLLNQEQTMVYYSDNEIVSSDNSAKMKHSPEVIDSGLNN